MAANYGFKAKQVPIKAISLKGYAQRDLFSYKH